MNICIFSPDRDYRYTLKHEWDASLPCIAWIGLNPSTADESKLDPTLRRVKDFSQRWGYGSFIMLNLFAYRATDPEMMKCRDDPVGPYNDGHILTSISHCKQIVVCWGRHGGYAGRGEDVIRKIARIRPISCLNLNKDGTPIHPLYVKADTPLKPLLHDY